MRMLSDTIIKRLSRIEDLPSMPHVLTEIISILDDENMTSKNLAALIEKDQMLVTRLLRVANSPFYGFSRKISTIELAIALIGLNTIRDIVTSILVKRIFVNKSDNLIDMESYWRYSVFCATATKYFASKMNYSPLGESFITGLMHDMGIVLLNTYFEDEYEEVFDILKDNENYSLINAEQKVLDSNHAEVASWLADKWNLPSRMCTAIKNHHYYFNNVYVENVINDQPLTVSLALAEYFARKLDFMDWNIEQKNSDLFISPDLFLESGENDMDAESSINIIQQDLMKLYENNILFTEL